MRGAASKEQKRTVIRPFFSQVADGFAAGAGCVDVGRFVGAEDGERRIGEALW